MFLSLAPKYKFLVRTVFDAIIRRALGYQEYFETTVTPFLKSSMKVFLNCLSAGAYKILMFYYNTTGHVVGFVLSTKGVDFNSSSALTIHAENLY